MNAIIHDFYSYTNYGDTIHQDNVIYLHVSLIFYLFVYLHTVVYIVFWMKWRVSSEKPMVACYICLVPLIFLWLFQKILSSKLDRKIPTVACFVFPVYEIYWLIVFGWEIHHVLCKGAGELLYYTLFWNFVIRYCLLSFYFSTILF